MTNTSDLNDTFGNRSIKAFDFLDETTNVSIIVSNLTTTISVNHSASGLESEEQRLSPNELNHSLYWMSALIIGLVSIVVLFVFFVRKRHFDKLRLNLMPIYKFDPSEESAEDWETELLDANVGENNGSNSKSRQLYTNERPQLSFARV